MTNLAIIQSIVTLHGRGGFYFRSDPAKYIRKTFEDFRDALIAYDMDQGFLVDAVSALKIASFGVQRGSYHDLILTETALERLHLGGQIKQLSLPNLISLAGFLSNARITGKLESLTHKVAENVGKELSAIKDDGSCQVRDVQMILQGMAHLASFNIFDTGRIKAIVEEINMMHNQDFDEPSDTIPMEQQRADLGRKIGDICHQVLFPISYAKSHQGGGGTQCSDREACSLVRLVAQLERTIALNDPDFQPVLDKRKLRRMNQLNQRPVPAVVYQSNLPAVGVSRRERLLSAAYNGLAYALKNPEFVRIVHLLPHFQDADIVMGHVAGMPMFVPLEWKKSDTLTDFLRAPEYGQWVVISVDGPSKSDLSLPDSKGMSARDTEPDRYSQLLKLGFEIYVIPAAEHQQLLTGHGTKWAHKLVANVLTGLPQGAPNPRSVPVH